MIIDCFAGGGGASLGIEQALGVSPDIAINHDAAALAMHAENHPRTEHLQSDIWEVSPRRAVGARTVDLAWFSPDCRHFSKAKGGQPVSDRVRSLAWVVVRWARDVRPRIILLENVEEFSTWGPLLPNGLPCPARRGWTFRRWWRELERLGYRLDARELRACDYGAPTIRKRLFIVARRDGLPIVWPEPTHGPGQAQAWRRAAECLDWSLPVPSIFDRPRPLAEATQRRIARGLDRYVLRARDPFLLAGPVAAWLAQHNGGMVGHDVRKPLSTITQSGSHQQLCTAALGEGSPRVRAWLSKYYGCGVGQSVDEPMHTVTTKDRLGLVQVNGRSHNIDDIGMRMLTPRELFRAQGFPDTYRIAQAGGQPVTKVDQVRLCGNSVCPPLAEALVRANVGAAMNGAAACS